MADVAAVFHWPPAAMDPMPVSELMGWRERARKRSQSPESSGKR
ncbi:MULTISPECIES: GpE family phage tail protein [unclassified Novosphingobium]|nr:MULTISPECIES: GpE family phage tail protein [unclassified Novosphingobium]